MAKNTWSDAIDAIEAIHDEEDMASKNGNNSATGYCHYGFLVVSKGTPSWCHHFPGHSAVALPKRSASGLLAALGWRGWEGWEWNGGDRLKTKDLTEPRYSFNIL